MNHYHTHNTQIVNKNTTSGGMGIGALLAIYLSWTVSHSVGYCVLHGMLSWFYVFYWLLNYGPLK